MVFSFLKKLAPKSLYGRFLMIIIIPTVLVQVLATYMFYERHWSNVSNHMARSLSGEISLLVNEFLDARTISEKTSRIEKMRQNLGLRAIFLPGARLPREKCGDDVFENLPKTKCLRAPPDEFAALEKNLAHQLKHKFHISIEEGTDDINVKIELPEGLLSITATNKRLTNPTTYIFIMWMSGSAIILLFVAILFLRNQVRSITRLAKAADKFGRGEEEEEFKPQGAKEVKLAGEAFLEMKDRILKQIAQRTDMLAGISHDLRTPLTRMKLQLAMVEKDKTVEALEKDVNEMEAMLSEYLDFLRGVGQERNQKIQLSELLGEIVDSYRNHNVDISLRVENDGTMFLRPAAIKRCLTNLINNSLRHGGSRIVLSADVGKSAAKIMADDNGPGVPEEKYEEVFKPFFRIESSRNQDKGSGAGLGLTIVKDIVQSHGGEISLDESPLGGLRVLITLPV